VRARHPFKEDLANSPEKWNTADEGVQYLRESAMLEVIYSDLDDDEVSKDPEDILCTQAMSRKVFKVPQHRTLNELNRHFRGMVCKLRK